MGRLGRFEEAVNCAAKKIDQFLKDKWFPEFITEFSKEAKIEKLLTEEKDPIARSNLISEFTKDAAKKLHERRASLTDATDALENLLRAASKVAITRKEFTEAVSEFGKLRSEFNTLPIWENVTFTEDEVCIAFEDKTYKEIGTLLQREVDKAKH